MSSNTDTGSVQETFDWTKDEYGGEVTVGVKFDPEVEYTLELASVTGKVIHVNDKPINLIETEWIVEESEGVKIRQSFFPGKQYVNEEHPEKTSAAIVLANALGYKVVKGDNFHVKQILKIGMKIKAHVIPQINKKKEETGFSVIDLKSARKVGGKAQSKNAHDPTDLAKWQKEISDGKYVNKEKFIGNLAQTGRVPEIAPFVAACEDGKINF